MEKLTSINLNNCDDVLRTCDIEKLQSLLGKKLGETLWSFCHGCDPRPVPHPQYGIGDDDRTLTVSVNWGIRLTSERGVTSFLKQMAQECERRLTDAEGTTSDLTLKVSSYLCTYICKPQNFPDFIFQILKRSPHAPVEPAKYGGCGECIELTNRVKLSKQASTENEISPHLARLWYSGIAR